MDTSIIYSLN
jgi:hypothetical protein